MKKSSQFIFLLLIASLAFSPLRSEAISIDITANVTGCGDNIVQLGEECDGSNLAGSSCTARGYTGGALSCTLSCIFNTTACTTNNGGNNGGGGGSSGGGGGSGVSDTPIVYQASVIFTGRAYPLSAVTLLKDGQVAARTVAGPDSNFNISLSGISTGNYNFAIFGEDKNTVRSSLFTFPVYITAGATTKISGIFIAPTISVDKSEVKKGDSISIFGQSTPKSDVVITVNSKEEHYVTRKSDGDGIYLLNFDTSTLELGQHHTKSKTLLAGDISSVSKVVAFNVGSRNINMVRNKNTIADVNRDGRVDLIDYSIVSYWYKRSSPSETVDLNSDGKVDLIDFSIMAYYWTG